MLRPYGNSIFLRYLFSYTRYELGSFEMSFVLRGLHLKLLMGMVMRRRIAKSLYRFFEEDPLSRMPELRAELTKNLA